MCSLTLYMLHILNIHVNCARTQQTDNERLHERETDQRVGLNYIDNYIQTNAKTCNFQQCKYKYSVNTTINFYLLILKKDKNYAKKMYTYIHQNCCYCTLAAPVFSCWPLPPAHEPCFQSYLPKISYYASSTGTVTLHYCLK